MRKMLVASDAFVHRISGQADESSGRDTLSNYHTIASNVGIARRSVAVSFVVFRAVPITLIAIFKFPIIWLKPFLAPVVMILGYVLFYRCRRLRALREEHKAHALGLEEAKRSWRDTEHCFIASMREAREGLTVRSAGFLAYRSAGTAVA